MKGQSFFVLCPVGFPFFQPLSSNVHMEAAEDNFCHGDVLLNALANTDNMRALGFVQLVFECLRSFFFIIPLLKRIHQMYSSSNSFSVKWNFVGKGEKQLSLEVGDIVHIQEICEGKNTSERWNNNYIMLFK